MKILLSPGEKVEIKFAETDGVIEVAFAFNEDSIRVTADMPDSTGRVGVIYEERFGAAYE